MDKKGQVTIFIIIAILVVGIVVSLFLFQDNLFGEGTPSQFEPIYNNFLNCLEEDLITGVSVLQTQGGYINLPSIERGSQKYPSSSQLNFVGSPIPYWYYVTGNGVEKEQIPTINQMESELENFIETQINTCIFQSYYEEGFEIDIEPRSANVDIRNREVELDFDANMLVLRGEERFFSDNHKITINSNLGNLYSTAREVYESQQEDLFLEDYAIDFLRNYAPVDGVELSCAPKVWNADNVFDDLQDAIEVNTLALKNSGDNEDYFNIGVDVEEEVRFVNSRNWPSSFEVLPADTNVLVANPVGNQPGLGALGFCYVTYHFVYNINYPVLVQVINGEEVFQFPVVVVVEGNQPREPLTTSTVDLEIPELCQYKNTLTEVRVFDSNSREIDANISYECFGTDCSIGETSNGLLNEEFPQCGNGQIYVSSEGFRDTSITHSTIQETSINIFLDREYEKEIRLLIDGRPYNGNAFITISSDDFSRSISYPVQKNIELSEGEYEIQVQIYEGSSITLEGTTSEQCVDVPRGFVGGIFGLTREECFEVEVPEQIISSSLSGGGTSTHSFLENDLRTSQFLDINTESLPTPTTLDELQVNYILFDERELEVALR